MDFVVVLENPAQKTPKENVTVIEQERETVENRKAAREKRYFELLGKERRKMTNREKLSVCEEQILSVLYFSKEDLKFVEVKKKAEERFGKSWKFQTVATFLTRLEQKKYISIYKEGKYSYCHPIISLADYREQKMNEVCEVLFEGEKEQMREYILTACGSVERK